jgi:hypothetical protein
MKNLTTLCCATALLGASLATPAMADHNRHFFTNENIGRIVGTGLGALAGSEVGKGRGNDAAIAIGAVGGYILGGKVGRDWNGHHNRGGSRHHGHSQARSHGHGHGHKKRHHGHKHKSPRNGYLHPVQAMPELEHIDAPFYANRTSNVRGGPGMQYVIVGGLQPGEHVRVLGRVVDTNWYMIAQNDIIQGFVHMNLLDPAPVYYGQNSY